jgi:AAA ATPase domain
VELLERERELAAIEALLAQGGVLLIEGGAGIGKTSLLEAAGARAAEQGHEILRARGSELEAGFAFGVVRQLFERRLAAAGAGEREELLEGPAAAVQPLLLGGASAAEADDRSFAVLHGLYWLTTNLADRGPSVLLVLDDAHWADDASLRWLAYLAPRLEGPAIALIVATRPADPASSGPPLLAVRAEAAAVARPELLTQEGVATMVRRFLGAGAGDRLCSSLGCMSGGNPFYLHKLLRSQAIGGNPAAGLELEQLRVGGGGNLVKQVAMRVRRLDPDALRFAQALAVLGDDCELRHAAAVAGLDLRASMQLAAGLVRVDVLESTEPVRFLHPVVRSAVEATLAGDQLDARQGRPPTCFMRMASRLTEWPLISTAWFRPGTGG